MSKTTNPNASTSVEKFARQIVINAPEGILGMQPQVQVDAIEIVTSAGLAPVTQDLGTVYQAPLAVCFAGPSTVALAAALGVTVPQLKTALVAWFDGMVSEAIVQ